MQDTANKKPLQAQGPGLIVVKSDVLNELRQKDYTRTQKRAQPSALLLSEKYHEKPTRQKDYTPGTKKGATGSARQHYGDENEPSHNTPERNFFQICLEL